MAAHPPSNPFPPNDGSNVFRRPKSKPPQPATRTDDEFAPDEPTDLTELVDDEDAIALPNPDSGEPISAVLFDDAPPSGEPISAVMLDDDAPPSGPPTADAIADWTPPASAADSSIFTGGTLPTTGVGSGWLDAPGSAARKPTDPPSGSQWAESVPVPASADGEPQPPSTSRFPDAAELFADLRPDAPESGGEWVEAAAHTGRVSDSEVRRALDANTPDEEDRPPSLAELDLADDPLASGFLGESGTGLMDRDDITAAMPVAGAAGSSIFDQPSAPVRSFHEDAEDDDATEGMLVFDDDEPKADRTDVTGRTTLADVDDLDDGQTELEAALFDDADDDLTEHQPSVVPAYRSANDTFPEPAPALPPDDETFTANFLDDLGGEHRRPRRRGGRRRPAGRHHREPHPGHRRGGGGRRGGRGGGGGHPAARQEERGEAAAEADQAGRRRRRRPADPTGPHRRCPEEGGRRRSARRAGGGAGGGGGRVRRGVLRRAAPQRCEGHRRGEGGPARRRPDGEGERADGRTRTGEGRVREGEGGGGKRPPSGRRRPKPTPKTCPARWRRSRRSSTHSS